MSDQHQRESRRSFLKAITSLPIAAMAPASLTAGAQNAPAPAKQASSSKSKFVAIQIGARSFVDEGVDKCLDTLHETGGVNVVMATVFTYGTGLAGRQTHGDPLPDHGGPTDDGVHGGTL